MKKINGLYHVTESELKMIVENTVTELLNEDALTEGKRLRNFLAGATMATSLFGANAQNLDDSRQGLPDNWGNSIEIVAQNLEDAGYENIRIKSDKVMYNDEFGKTHFAVPRAKFTEQDYIEALCVNQYFKRELDKAVRDGKLDIREFESIAPIDTLTLKQVYGKAKSAGFDKDDFMLYYPGNSEIGFILPNVDNIKDLL